MYVCMYVCIDRYMCQYVCHMCVQMQVLHENQMLAHPCGALVIGVATPKPRVSPNEKFPILDDMVGPPF